MNKQRKEIREALLTCFTSDDIKELLNNLFEIANDNSEKTNDRIKASQVILDYSIGKPKQDYGIELENDKITGYTFKVVRPNENNLEQENNE